MQLADLCSRIHLMAPNADGECSNILNRLNTTNSSTLKQLHQDDTKPVFFDKVLAEHRENTVEYFTLKAELDIVNREIGKLISDFRNVLLAIDSSESATSAQLNAQDFI